MKQSPSAADGPAGVVPGRRWLKTTTFPAVPGDSCGYEVKAGQSAVTARQ